MGLFINACLMLGVPMFICIKKFNMSLIASFCVGAFIFLYDKIAGAFIAAVWFEILGKGLAQSLAFSAFYLATLFAGLFAVFMLAERDSYLAKCRTVAVFGYAALLFAVFVIISLVSRL